MRPRTILVIFSIYGLLLCLMGVLVAGSGHGTYTLIGLAGAPFSFLGIPVAIVAALTQWALLVLVQQKSSKPKVYCVAFLMLHYVSGFLLLWLPSSEYADWSYIAKLPYSVWLVLVLGFGWYVFGQVFFWMTGLSAQRAHSLR